MGRGGHTLCRWIYTSTSNTLDKKDGGNVATQEVGTYLVYHCYLAESVSRLISIVRERERENQRDREVCHAVDHEDQATCVVA